MLSQGRKGLCVSGVGSMRFCRANLKAHSLRKLSVEGPGRAGATWLFSLGQYLSGRGGLDWGGEAGIWFGALWLWVLIREC